jgi:hypothetical protein
VRQQRVTPVETVQRRCTAGGLSLLYLHVEKNWAISAGAIIAATGGSQRGSQRVEHQIVASRERERASSPWCTGQPLPRTGVREVSIDEFLEVKLRRVKRATGVSKTRADGGDTPTQHRSTLVAAGDSRRTSSKTVEPRHRRHQSIKGHSVDGRTAPSARSDRGRAGADRRRADGASDKR